MKGLAIIQIVFFVWYIVYIIRNYGVLPSISDSWYKLLEDKKSNLFVVFTAGVGLPMWGYSIYGFEDIPLLLLVICGFSLFVVGVASDFRNKMVDKIHYAGAVTSIGTGFASIILYYHDWYPLGIFVVSCILLKLVKVRWKEKVYKVTNYTWWIEILAFVLIIYKLI